VSRRDYYTKPFAIEQPQVGNYGASAAAGVVATVVGSFLGYRAGLEVTIYDATTLKVAGGSIEIAGTIYKVSSEQTVATGTLSAASTYYLYMFSSGFEISATAPVYSNLLGAMYKTGDTTRRWLATLTTA
jgi:hypothetical protein